MALPIEPAHASRRASAVGSMLLLVGSAACLSAPSKVPQASDAASAAAISASLAGRYDNMAQVKRGKTSGQTPPPQHVIITIEPTPQDDWQIWRIHMDVDPEVAQLAGSDTSLDAVWAMNLTRRPPHDTLQLVPYTLAPAVDLAASADALHEPQNRLYERKFVRGLVRRFRRKASFFPRAYDPHRAANITSLREFDERITSLYCGFTSADDYYARAGAARVLDRITVPTLILHAEDDPFVRITSATRSTIAANPHITFLATEHGGHCAFLAPSDTAAGNDGYWAEHTALRFVLAHA